MATTLTTVLVLTTAGTIDQAASEAAFRTSLANYIAEREVEEGNIADAVHAVFDKYRGASINMPALAGFVLQQLNVQPENFNALEERVMEYVRNNADLPEKKDKSGKVIQAAEAPRTRTFAIGKGKGGGVKRWSDHPAKDATSA